MKNRNRWNNRKGFTMAELMLVVAIIIVLASLAFVGVTRYLRSLHLMEMDNAAKEIFYAAQNRITAELNSGALGRLDDTKFEADQQNATAKGMVDDSELPAPYAIVYSGAVTDLDTTLWDEMLPFGSIDETVRLSGSYIITYSYDKASNMATVLDVWYASDERSGLGRNWSGSESRLLDARYTELKAARISNDRDNRLRFPDGNGPAVVGHYGRDDVNLLDKLYNFKDLDFKLVNDEILYGDFEFKAEDLRSTATDKTMSADSVLSTLKPQLKLTITGVESKATMVLPYTDIWNLTEKQQSKNVIRINSESDTGKSVTYRFILDNITKEGERFRDLVTTKEGDGKSLTGTFKPGEDIRVNVEVYSNEKLSNIDSASAVDNSLFQYVKKTTDNVGTTTTEAGIGKIRHLQNLSSDVSNVNLCESGLNVDRALQTADLDWNGFKDFKLIETDNTTKIGGSIVYNENSQTNNSFYPIDLKPSPWSGEIFGESYLTYDGTYTVEAATETATEKTGCRSISNLIVNSVHAGLFGTVGKNSTEPVPKSSDDKERVLLTVQNLEIDAATITGETSAGAVVANEVNAVRLNGVTISGATVKATNGNAGGAVGKAVNGLDLVKVTVTGNSTKVTATNGNAGGLIGEFKGTSDDVHIKIDSCYVGGADNKDSKGITVTSDGTNAAAAGGLVGKITTGLPTIQNSYSTALVSGDVAGGLVGAVEKCDTGSLIKYSYVGGHTVENTAKYDKDADNCNVKGKTVAGGFIGSLGADADKNLSVLFSYTTASASGDQAGGFIGKTAAEVMIARCYAVGLVVDKTPESTPSGAFVGDSTGTLNGSGNNYFELINGDMLAVAGSSHENSFVQSAESSLQTYNYFVKLGSDNEFFPYDPQLGTMFGTRYFLPTVKDLADLNPDAANAPATHVGDWQPVDTLVTNKPDGT